MPRATRPAEAEAVVRSLIGVTDDLVMAAKQFLLSHPSNELQSTRDLVARFSAEQGAPFLNYVTNHADHDNEAELNAAATRINCELALNRAVWQLVGDGRIQ